MRSGDWKKILEVADSILTKDPRDLRAGEVKFRALAIHLGQPDKGYEFLKQFIEPHWDNPAVLNSFAWLILDDKDLQTRDVNLAIGYAMHANKLTKEKDPAILDTLARAWYQKGNLTQAVAIETQAATIAPDDATIQATLKKYQDELDKQGG